MLIGFSEANRIFVEDHTGASSERVEVEGGEPQRAERVRNKHPLSLAITRLDSRFRGNDTLKSHFGTRR